MRIKQELIDEVMDNFDFKKVEQTMRFLNWTWVNEVPNEKRLRSCVRDLIKTLQDDENCGFTATGGFVVTFEDGILNIAFILEERAAYESYFSYDEA